MDKGKKFEIGIVATIWYNVKIDAATLEDAERTALIKVYTMKVNDLVDDLKSETRIINDWNISLQGICDPDALNKL